ncbi:taste receptor type 1 member 2-like [Triplophysa rosa]|uniref:taste receptor type 1 member 2-like n=1 Tax=Triplophysa rosa TaxID=992332 RepID=UPI002545FA68|nr:taste receptor type 1 member 2-like [Triplophysa rosa]
MIIRIIQWFGWNWVAFLRDPDNYSEDGLQLFNSYIKNTGICLAFHEVLSQSSNYSLTFQKINRLNINVIVVFTGSQYAKNIIKEAIANNIRNKVWIASETWSMNQQLPKEPGLEKIGTIVGITERILSLPGFHEFIYKAKGTTEIYTNDNAESEIQMKTCNQYCDNCSMLTAKDIINEDPTFSFAIYSAIYTIAHALHKVLRCDINECRTNITVKPYMLLGEMKQLDFPLSGRQVKYDVNGDPAAVSYAVVLWHTETNPPWIQMVGTYETHPEITFTINNSLMPWRNNTAVPFSNCSVECKEGFSRERVGYHDCCFLCKKCPQNNYVNYSQATKQLILVELTVPWEERMEEAQERKREKYQELVEDCWRNGWRTEVGSREFASHSLSNAYGTLGITGANRRREIGNNVEAAEKASRWLWLKSGEQWGQ